MFPYYWNGLILPKGENILGLIRRDSGYDNLPEEVLEALENHKDFINTSKDRDRYIDELNLRK